MRVPTSFAFLVPLAAAALAGCPGPEGGSGSWSAGSCYCDDNGCHDYDGNECTPSGGSNVGSSGRISSSSGSSGHSNSSSGESSSGESSSGESSSGQSSSGESSSGESSSGQSSSGESSSGEVSSSSSGEVSSSSSSGGPQPNCSTNDDCGANQTCQGGFCRFQCSSDDQCRSFDNRLNKCVQGICRAQ